jgi:hypothetical protein
MFSWAAVRDLNLLYNSMGTFKFMRFTCCGSAA